ncbi:MauE/DoxX family redox-associated membrane protein [Pseudofrankia sp. DC12]|uniref:MauE/DoxX family redox-associated membrane protein n=1 Tax=Pseudofrankia sp. DC12 TaxID=683315 RepID=UPI0005F839B5|nr:MauE/DoxX family redox-associated membrane protein [Pseudofrankia sp. DC12]
MSRQLLVGGAPPHWGRVASTLLRVGLGVLWLVAGSLKAGDADGMVRSVRAFRILPEALVHPVAYAVPFVEIALGVLLLLGLAVRAGALLSCLLLAVYIGAIASAAARGLHIECGCFSKGGDLAKNAPTHYTSELVRDSLLLLASVLLTVWPHGYLTLDRLLFGPAADDRPAASSDLDDDWDDASWDDDDRGDGRRGDGHDTDDSRDGGDWQDGYRARAGDRPRSGDRAGRMRRER